MRDLCAAARRRPTCTASRMASCWLSPNTSVAVVSSTEGGQATPQPSMDMEEALRLRAAEPAGDTALLPPSPRRAAHISLYSESARSTLPRCRKNSMSSRQSASWTPPAEVAATPSSDPSASATSSRLVAAKKRLNSAGLVKSAEGGGSVLPDVLGSLPGLSLSELVLGSRAAGFASAADHPDAFLAPLPRLLAPAAALACTCGRGWGCWKGRPGAQGRGP